MLKEVSVIISTEKHIKAYIEKNFGVSVPFANSKFINSLIKLCLMHDKLRDSKRKRKYPCEVKLYIPIDSYERFGSYFNPNQSCKFNHIVDEYLKHIVASHITAYLHVSPVPVLKEAIYYALDRIKLDDDDWEYDSVKRYYSRYREEHGLPTISELKQRLSA